MKKKVLKKLLKYEIELLRWGRKIEEAIALFGIQNPDFDPALQFCNYELLNIVLDDIGVPPDSKKARDKYNDLYYEYWNNPDLNAADILDDLEDIRDEK
jgi:hypothetical protein